MPAPSAARRSSKVVARIGRTALLVAMIGGSAVASGQEPSHAAPPAPTSNAAKDSTSDSSRGRRDAHRESAGVVLAPVEVRASIVPSAGPTIGSGVPARVSVVSGLELESWKRRRLADALATQPGVSIYDDLGSSWKLNLSTRGFTAGPTVGLPPGITVFLDGVRQNEADAQEVNFDLLPLENVERVELLSGSASLLGPNSLGGAINLVTARGEGAASGAIELSAGTFGEASVEAHAGGGTAGGTDYFIAGGYGRDRGWRQATAARNYNALANLGHRSSTRGITLQVYGARSRVETAGSLPESLFDSAPRTNFTTGDFEDLDAQQIALSGFAPLAAGRGRITAYVRRSQAERFNVNQAPDPNVRALTSNVTIGASTDWRRTIAARFGDLSLRLGVEGSANRVRARIYAEPVDVSATGGGDPADLTTDVKSPSFDVAG